MPVDFLKKQQQSSEKVVEKNKPWFSKQKIMQIMVSKVLES